MLSGKKPSAPVIEAVVARSPTNEHNEEDAWVSLITASQGRILILQFPSADYGEGAWARAVEYRNSFAERLGVDFRNQRMSAPKTEDRSDAEGRDQRR